MLKNSYINDTVPICITKLKKHWVIYFAPNKALKALKNSIVNAISLICFIIAFELKSM